VIVACQLIRGKVGRIYRMCSAMGEALSLATRNRLTYSPFSFPVSLHA
jgi:hypothetical protein